MHFFPSRKIRWSWRRVRNHRRSILYWMKRLQVTQMLRSKCAHIQRGVITCRSCVEMFMTRLKLNQAIKVLLESWSRDEYDLWTPKINESIMHGCNLTFEPLKIKSFRREQSSNQTHSSLIKNLDPSHKTCGIYRPLIQGNVHNWANWELWIQN